jgi:superfamily II DNA/RNA helicase
MKEKNENINHETKGKGKKAIKNKQQKRRRFAQDVEPIVAIQAPPSPYPPPPPQSSSSFSSTKQHQPYRGKINKSNSSGSAAGKNPMLQNGKSIDELEDIMSNRWGDRLDKWTADFDQWEVVYDDDDGDDDTNKNKNDNSNNDNRSSLKSGRKVRSRAVLNPWDKEERERLYQEKKEYKEKKKKGMKEEVATNASLFKSAQDRQHAVLERVRKNQERLRDQSDQKKTTSGEIEEPSDEIDLDFYDEDDEGYEAPSSRRTKIYDEDDEGLEDEATDFYDNLISPRPVGGMGSLKKVKESFNESDNDNKGGFFFNEAAATISDNENKVEIQEIKKKEKKEPTKKIISVPKLDDQGRKMFLTVEQANRNSDTFLSSNNETQNDDDKLVFDQELSWEDIGITHPALQNNLEKMDCLTPLSVQDKACPSIVSGNDVLVSTHTGSGKTLAFLAPLAQRLLFDIENQESDPTQGVQVVIIAPGRELASQIVSVARDLFQGTELSAMLAIGGTPFSRNYEQIRKKKPSFVIGTPGRIAELVVGKPGEKNGKLKIAALQTIVLDECDALLEYKPHREPTAAIMDVLKRRHRDSLQTVLCSATAGDLVATSKIDGYLRDSFAHAQSDENDQSITAASSEEFSRTRVSRTAIHGVVKVPHRRHALDVLRKILYTDPAPQQALIFVDNARRVGIIVDKLAEMNIVAAPLHGGQGSEKGDRAEVNKALREGFVGLVVATEMAARGIDAPYLTHVINLDLPTDASHYAHRAGRCGRGGRPGVVVNIAVGKREENVPKKFAKALNIEMFNVETQAGKLTIVESDANKETKDKI